MDHCAIAAYSMCGALFLCIAALGVLCIKYARARRARRIETLMRALGARDSSARTSHIAAPVGDPVAPYRPRDVRTWHIGAPCRPASPADITSPSLHPRACFTGGDTCTV
jgi:hypothetical protein